MQMYRIYSIYLVIILFSFGCSTSSPVHYAVDFENRKDTTNIVLSHDCFTVGYHTGCKQARWVAYTLRKSDLNSDVHRKNNFKTDPKLAAKYSADDKDYYKSGYDRGHLAPAADMTKSRECMDQSFYYSNISPQMPGQNRGVWKRLEELVREYAVKYDSVLVITGAILENETNEYLGESKVCIPKEYYKALLIRDKGEVYTIGFIVPNQPSKEELSGFTIVIDDLEDKTNLNFFPNYNKKTQSKIESVIIKEKWFF